MINKIPRLTYGFLSASSSPKNIKFPWTISEKDGMWAMNYSWEEAILTNLSFWAQTNKGEYVGDVNFGLDAIRYLFDPQIIIKDHIIQNCREQLPKYFPNLKIDSISVLTKEDDDSLGENVVKLRLECSIVSDKNRNIKFETIIGA